MRALLTANDPKRPNHKSARCLSGILSDVQPRLACTLDKMIRDLPPPASVIAQEECSPSDWIFGRKRGKLLSGAFEVLAKITACLILLTEIGLANRPFQEHVRRWICNRGERVQRFLVALGIQIGLPKGPQLPASHKGIKPASALDHFDCPFGIAIDDGNPPACHDDVDMVRIEAQRDAYFVFSFVEFAELQQHVGQTGVRVAVSIIECARPFRRCQGFGERCVGFARPAFFKLARPDKGKTSVCQGKIWVELNRLSEKLNRCFACRWACRRFDRDEPAARDRKQSPSAKSAIGHGVRAHP